jgi:thiol-disulfide isomerase/thioredoxin
MKRITLAHCLVALLLAATSSVAGVRAQNPPVLQPGSPTSVQFNVNHDFEVTVDGETLTSATCYTSRETPGVILIDASLGGAIFTRISDRKVLSINPLEIRINGEQLTLKSESAFGEEITGWTLDASAAEFTLDGRKVRVQPRPIVLGTATVEELLKKTPSYRHLMDLYEPDLEALAFLKEFSEQVNVEVFFGSWCHVCKQYLPQLLRTISDCENSNIQLSFYGLPRKFTSDERARQKGIKGVPCVIVSKEGREVGRIEGPPTRSYEKDLGGLFRLAASR